jgi:CBS domain-containing membrane protein
MFNFAVAGSLERYQPMLRDPSVKPVDSVTKAKEAHGKNIGSGEPGFELPVGSVPPSGAKAQIMKGYGSRQPAGEPRQRRRAWLVSDLMTRSVKTLSPEDTVFHAWNLLESTGFRHIPILSQEMKVEGLLSDRDLLRLSPEQKRDPNLPLSSIMTKRVLTCLPETSLRLAASTMLEEGFSSLPVVNPQGVLLGILTTGDILKALVNESPLDLWT